MTTASSVLSERPESHLPSPPELRFQQPTTDTLSVRLAGNWTLAAETPAIDGIAQQLETAPQVRRLTFETQELQAWDSTLLSFLLKCQALCNQRQLTCDLANLPEGIQRLLRLATAVPERSGARCEAVHEPIGRSHDDNLLGCDQVVVHSLDNAY